MNKYLTYLAFLPILASCNEENLSVEEPFNAEAVEIKGVEAYIDGNTSTRAAALDAYNYVGRSAFINNDQMVLTTIKRTDSPIDGFSYSGIVYDHVVEENQTSGGWNRDNSKGRTEAKNEAPERIYWSDAKNGHTYIGYSVPQQETDVNFDWTVKDATYEGSGSAGIPVYYGSLGNPATSGFIDYTNNAGETPVKDNPDDNNSALSYKSGNDKIQRDDILLTYDNAKVAETGGSVAKLYFHHGLAQVRVIVNIQGFSASSSAVDSRSVVSGMILKNMLTMYKWRQQSYAAEALDEQYDKNNINAIYNSGADGTVKCDQKKDVHLWIPRPDGTGTGVGKQFTFYGLAVPTTMTEKTLDLEFTVTYQDPMNPWKDAQKTEPNMKDHTYKAQMETAIEFRAGHCTTINISLNHNNEQMTVGAEYMDWQLVETPDEGELKKNLTFLDHTDRSKVTIFGDEKATVDDATWLYVDPTTNKILDIYGNDGTEANPFKISTAEQLLSFAYEVKGTDRKAVDKVMVFSPSEDYALMHVSEGAGFDFSGYYVKLDADITMQKSLEIMHDAGGFYTLGSNDVHVTAQGVTWPGIGDKDHKFNGIFNGGYRHINRLYGEPFFNTIGPDGIVDHIFITDALGITGRGSIAEVNNGVICGAYIEGDVVATKDSNTTGDHSNCCGSIVGENHSMLISCAHIGDIKGTGYDIVGALLGYNDGIVAICYNCGDVNGNGVAEYAGIGDYSARSIAYCSYFNGDLYKGHGYDDLNARIGHVAYPLTTAVMQSNVFVNKVAPYEGLTKEHEIIDDGLALQTDPFFFHLSLNYGIRRAVAMLKRVLAEDKTQDEYVAIHGAQSGDNPFEVLKLKKSLVQWLIDHYSYVNSDDGLDFSHQFKFSPGTYPKLQ